MELGEIKKLLQAENYSVRDGKIYFAEPPKDAYVSSGEADFGSWTPWRKTNFKFFKKELAGGREGQKLLDVGSGPSQFRALFEKFEVISMDFYPYERVDIVADFTKGFPFKEAQFDLLVLSNVLEHLPNPDFVLKECRRVLAPGGKILGTVPFLAAVHQAPYDFLRPTNFMLKRLLEGAGFSEAEVVPLGSPLQVYLSFQRKIFKLAGRNFLWRLQRFLNKFFLPGEFKNSLDFAEGYGFKACLRP